MIQPFEEAGTERICPHCGSWKVFPFTGEYYRCHSEKCNNRLIEQTELLIREMEEKTGEELI